MNSLRKAWREKEKRDKKKSAKQNEELSKWKKENDEKMKNLFK
jgi:hypothetical protein